MATTSEVALNRYCPTCGVSEDARCVRPDGRCLPRGQTHAARRTLDLPLEREELPLPTPPKRRRKGKAEEPGWDACLDCMHADCPIVPDCSGCASCAEERERNGGRKAPRAIDKLLPKNYPKKAGAEGPGSSAPAVSVTAVALSLIRRDGGTQPRVALDPSVIEEYAEAYEAGAELPPLVVYWDALEYWLADGFHRAAALERAGIDFARVDVRRGTRRDAILYSCGANAAHGLRRTRADRRRAVETLLRDEEWGRRTDRWIAEQCGVSPTTVGTVRAELAGLGEVSSLDTSEREGRDGKIYKVPAKAERASSGDAHSPSSPLEPSGDVLIGGGWPVGGPESDPLGPVGGSLNDPPGSQSDPPSPQSDPPRTAKRSWREVLELPPGRIDPGVIIDQHIRLSSHIGRTAVEQAELDRARAYGLSQWHTPPDLADRMVELLGLARLDRPCVLEPSAGGGALVAAIRRACGREVHITAHEIDPVYVDRLRKAPSGERPDVVHQGDFLWASTPSRPYDATVMNSPYEGGADGAFLARAMEVSLRIVALCRLNVTTGVDRYERVWSRVQEGEWCLLDEAVLSRRPDFVGPGDDSAKSDYVVVHLAHHSISHRTLTRKVWW